MTLVSYDTLGAWGVIYDATVTVTPVPSCDTSVT